ncbi:MAG: hypothetical protein QM820_36550 [Minicystis sp.]
MTLVDVAQELDEPPRHLGRDVITIERVRQEPAAPRGVHEAPAEALHDDGLAGGAPFDHPPQPPHPSPDRRADQMVAPGALRGIDHRPLVLDEHRREPGGLELGGVARVAAGVRPHRLVVQDDRPSVRVHIPDHVLGEVNVGDVISLRNDRIVGPSPARLINGYAQLQAHRDAWRKHGEHVTDRQAPVAAARPPGRATVRAGSPAQRGRVILVLRITGRARARP